MIGKFLESQIYEKNTIFALSESITMMENPKNRKWKVLTSEYLARKPWFTVRHESLELPDGRRIPDYYVFEYPDWINVTAVTRDGRFVLIDQYRHGLGETSYEIPAGVTEPSDASPLDAAQRELMEETGYGGGQWRLLTTLSANPATQNNLTYCYLATGVEPLGEQRLDPTEDLRVHLLTREEVLELLRTDRIRQALMAAPLWRYFGEGNE
ncbi:NTP pyrophosphohydrolases including oxidative damage repair enzymes [Alistipes shahii WAL 8301]|uniref:GDP-mannose pyrophosphatase n=3 Tax=Alistipes shahii TaxID=328814 RepID=D4ILF7_9BACT|nr:NTP pyrophosphohydrolases including oxidative damage repair enzymes [Alistipes shahii WAL 8301]